MKRQRAWAAAAGTALTLLLSACGSGYYGAGTDSGGTPSVFTYDTYTQVWAIHVSGPTGDGPRDAVAKTVSSPEILWLVRLNEYPSRR
jgi:hypothetical protein